MTATVHHIQQLSDRCLSRGLKQQLPDPLRQHIQQLCDTALQEQQELSRKLTLLEAEAEALAHDTAVPPAVVAARRIGVAQ